MTGPAWLLLSWVLVGAAVLVAHALVLRQCLSARELPRRVRLLAFLLPPVAPLVAWIAGRRVAPVLWAGLLVAYLVLRGFE